MLRVAIVTLLFFLMGCQSKPHDYLSRSNPRDFAVLLYAQVLMKWPDFEKTTELAKQVLTENLSKNLIAVQKIEVEEGICCINANIFTDSQDIMSGFLIDSVEEKDDFTVVAVCTGMDVKSIKSPALYLHLTRISGRWRISDILYVRDKSLKSLHDMLVSCLHGEQRAEFY